ncbi:MAG: DNA methyltransferase [Verrucomicrobiota bacterium]
MLDPACGSGNFLYVSLQLLLSLEKEVVAFATQLGFKFKPEANVQQLRAIELNPYAFELAQVSVQIGFLQWRRDNGFDNDRTPVLQNLDGFQNGDALLVPHFKSKAKTLKEAQAGEHAGDDALKFYTEREWPEADVIVGNPPFLGSQLMRGELDDNYVSELRKIYGERIPGQSDLCCYWFEKARDLIEHKKCKRAGLLATQGIRGGANREVLKRIKETGDIFFAESSRDWILAGANVHVSMVGFDDGKESNRILDSKKVVEISNSLSTTQDLSDVVNLEANKSVCFQGPVKVGSFEIQENEAVEMLKSPNPHGQPSSDVLFRWINGNGVTKREPPFWIIDFGASQIDDAGKYEAPFRHIQSKVKPERLANRDKQRSTFWWKLGRSGGDWKTCSKGLHRTIFTPRVSKHRIFVWVEGVVLPDSAVVGFARSDDYTFGILHSRFHEVWSLKQGTFLETRPRYTPTTCFETFPFPFPDDLSLPSPASKKLKPKESGWEDTIENRFLTVREEPPAYHTGGATAKLTPAEHRAAIAAAAKELYTLRERWLNPPEWTVEKILEFPGSLDGPWARYIDPSSIRNSPSSLGLVRYPRLEPRDADCAAKLKARTLTKLYNERPAWLDLAHKKLDAAVAAAYGFPADLTDEQILEKLLALNLERAAEEAKTAKVMKPKAIREKHEDEMI